MLTKNKREKKMLWKNILKSNWKSYLVMYFQALFIVQVDFLIERKNDSCFMMFI